MWYGLVTSHPSSFLNVEIGFFILLCSPQESRTPLQRMKISRPNRQTNGPAFGDVLRANYCLGLNLRVQRQQLFLIWQNYFNFFSLGVENFVLLWLISQGLTYENGCSIYSFRWLCNILKQTLMTCLCYRRYVQQF